MEKDKEGRPSVWFFAEWISTIGTFIVCFVFLFYQNQNQCSRIDQIIYTQNQRSDQLYDQFQTAIQAQNARSDRLYEMFYEVVKRNGE